MASKLHQPAPLLCYPYGVSITCVCDPQGAIFNCFPTNYKRVAQFGELNKRNSINKAEMDQDEKVEIILASTALVAVIALFLSFLMYKVEKYFNKNEYQLPIMDKYKNGQCIKHSSAAQTDHVLYFTERKNLTRTSSSLRSISSSSCFPPRRHSFPSVPLATCQQDFYEEEHVDDDDDKASKREDDDEGYGTNKHHPSISMQPLLNFNDLQNV